MKNLFGLKGSYPYKKRNLGVFISRMVILIAFFLFVSGFVLNQSAVAQNEPQIKVGENIGSTKSGNQPRQYLLYIPEGYDAKTDLPLVFLFHGSGGTPKMSLEVTDWSKVANKKKFIIAAPEGIYPYMGMRGGQKSWNADLDPQGVNDVEFVKDLIREISSKVLIDKKRMYATGFSAGARMSSRLGCELSNVIAAIGPFAGLQCAMNCAPTHSVSVIAFNGTADMTSPYALAENSVSCWAEKNGCNKTPTTRKISEDVTQISYGGCKDNAEAVFFSINGVGHTWPKDINASNLIWSFFEAHPLP